MLIDRRVRNDIKIEGQQERKKWVKRAPACDILTRPQAIPDTTCTWQKKHATKLVDDRSCLILCDGEGEEE